MKNTHDAGLVLAQKSYEIKNMTKKTA